MFPKKIHDNFINTFEDESPYSTVKKWAAESRRGRESVEDYVRSGRLKVELGIARKNVSRYQTGDTIHYRDTCFVQICCVLLGKFGLLL